MRAESLTNAEHRNHNWRVYNNHRVWHYSNCDASSLAGIKGFADDEKVDRTPS